jgi:purine-nucleoside phosphorylase
MLEGGDFNASPEATALRLKKCSSLRPTLAMVLGSGFGHVLSMVKPEARIAYEEVPGFPPAGVKGHSGEIVLGTLADTPVLMLGGRAHFYEGHPMSRVTFAVRALAAYGITDLLLTNAAGGIHRALRPGDFMLINDHINLMGINPLRGAAAGTLSCFVDLSMAYDKTLSEKIRLAAKTTRSRLHSGVYLAVSGPSYETPAEIRAFARLGADAVGMSTVPEVIVARQCGLRVAALSCITNLAAGIGCTELSHQEVLDTASRVRTKAAALLTEFAKLYATK